ncbi:MAG: SOS response-associated peptidase family protein [Gammaproteobacteria bacterium]|nr:SOS response-associated peptidase family protein [Gammaproteobacteria bacterium]
MCGRFNVTDNLAVRKMMTDLGIPLYEQDKLVFSIDISPGARISIVRQGPEGITLSDATWWLMLDPATLKPNNKYASFNTRSDKLNVPRSLGYHPYRKSRCIIPATAFIEGAGDKKTYHKIHFEDRAIAFGGLYREWISKETGEIVRSASIITLPPVPEWEMIHPKSIPLMLPEDAQLRQHWLNPEIQEVEQFEYLLIPKLDGPHIATPIGKVSQWNEIGPSFTISPEV